MIVRALLVVGAVLAGTAGDARACKFPLPAAYRPTPFAGDTVSPTAPTVTWSVRKPSAWVFGTCNTWCTATGFVDLAVSATDNRVGEVGYEVRIVDPPPELQAVFGAPVVADQGRIWIPYRDGAFTLDIEIRAVDGNGNVSPPTRVQVGVPRHVYWGRWIGGALVAIVAWLVGRARRRKAGSTGLASMPFG